jgi:hypothetical protein
MATNPVAAGLPVVGLRKGIMRPGMTKHKERASEDAAKLWVWKSRGREWLG